MCFSTKTNERDPPSKTSEEARKRIANELALARQQQGTAATVLTTPLGDTGYGQNVTKIKPKAL